MTSLPMPILCLGCTRLRDDQHGTCEAFPAGIPDAIWERGGDHRQPVKGDHGLQFASAPGADGHLALWEQLNRLRTDDPFEGDQPQVRAGWSEADHPRNPADGKFTGLPSAGKLLPGGQQDAAGNPLHKGDKVAFGNTTGTVVGGSKNGQFLSVKWDHDGSTNKHVVPGNVKVINERPEAGGQPSSAPHLDGKFIDELDDFDIDPDVGLPKAKGPIKPKAKPKRPTKAKPKAQAPAPTVTLTDGELDDFDDAPMDLGAPPDLDPPKPKPKPKDTASHRYGRETVDRFNQVERGQDHTDLPPDWEQDRIDKLESNYGWWEDLPPDKRQAVRDLVAETSRKPTYVRMFPYGLGQTTRDGRMKNVHETRSKTDSYIDERSDYENAVMGLADAADRDKPIYGYIGDIETADAYGPVAVKLKPSVRERTTATVGDSLNGLTQPYGVDQMPDLTDDQLLANIHGGADAQDHLLRGGIQDYMEAQIHGGVDLDDIESVTVDLEPGDTLDDMFEPETLATLRDRGIPVVVSREGGRAGDR